MTMNRTRFVPYSLVERLLKILHFRYIYASRVNLSKILFAIILNKSIKHANYTLSNYGVWMIDRADDRTFRLSILGYRNSLEKIISRIQTPTSFLDIGANQGVFSLVAATNPNIVRIHSFEPNLKIVEFLRINFAANNIKNFTIHGVAISIEEKTANFLVPEHHSGAGKITQLESNMTVRSVNHFYLNEYITETQVSYFVKIDVEGHEFEVLQELFKSKLSFDIKSIFVEIIRESQNEPATLQILHENGFVEKFRKSNSISYDALFTRLP